MLDTLLAGFALLGLPCTGRLGAESWGIALLGLPCTGRLGAESWGIALSSFLDGGNFRRG